MNILAVIPARSGSKSIKNKNIRRIAGKPLIAYSIEHALASRYITRTIVSTDSPLYARVARNYGAEVPFLRPADISGDFATDLEVFTHALHFIAEHGQPLPEICVHLRPTYPIREAEDIDNMIKLLMADPNADSVRSICPSPVTPYKMWFKKTNGYIEPVATLKNKPQAFNLPRQVLPKAFMQNACIDVVRTAVILNRHSMTGTKILGYEMSHFYDIDHPEELKMIRNIITRKNGKR